MSALLVADGYGSAALFGLAEGIGGGGGQVGFILGAASEEGCSGRRRPGSDETCCGDGGRFGGAGRW
ncbi:hypothetical protein GCM10020229_27550 [Kitasatospora albolonga]